MRAHWTHKALRRLREIHDYIALDSPGNARGFADKLTQRAELIAHQPRAGRMVPKYQRDDIRETFEGDYRIVYRILAERIDTLTVRHGARLMPTKVRDL